MSRIEDSKTWLRRVPPPNKIPHGFYQFWIRKHGERSCVHSSELKSKSESDWSVFEEKGVCKSLHSTRTACCKSVDWNSIAHNAIETHWMQCNEIEYTTACRVRTFQSARGVNSLRTSNFTLIYFPAREPEWSFKDMSDRFWCTRNKILFTTNKKNKRRNQFLFWMLVRSSYTIEWTQSSRKCGAERNSFKLRERIDV